MEKILQIVQLVTAVIMVVAILLQHRGSGLGGAFGSDNVSFRSRRGIEKLLLRGTVLLGTVFLACSILLFAL